MNARILASLSHFERAQLNLPPSILRRLEDEDRDRSWFEPDATHPDAWWLYVAADHRAQANSEARKQLSRQLSHALAANAQLQAEIDALRAQFLSGANGGGVK